MFEITEQVLHLEWCKNQ